MDISFPGSPLSSKRLKLKYVTGTNTWKEKEASFNFQKMCETDTAFLKNSGKNILF